MKEDLSDCPTGLYVNFVYDYNTQRADMLKDHVGYVEVNVYDESDCLVAQHTVDRSQLAVYGCYTHFTEQELAPGHQYRIVALGLQRDWTEALQAEGAKYRKSGQQRGCLRSDLLVTLDHQAPALPLQETYHEVPATAPLDTLWHTLQMMTATDPMQPVATRHHELANGSVNSNGLEWVSVKRGVPTYVTVSLVRDTKHLNISLRELDFPGQVEDDDYDVFIVDANAALDCNNAVVAAGDSVVYRPYAQWTTGTEGNGAVAADHSAHYDLMFNRLMYNSTEAGANAVLCIRKHDTGDMVAMLNLPYILCEGRLAYEINNYQPQEYLDREYDYRLELFLKGGRWEEGCFISICVDVLSWSKRVMYVKF